MYLFRGLAVFLAVAGPWYYVMYALHGMDFVNMFLGLHNYLRATVSEHPQDNVFYYYLVLFPVSLLPWSGVLAGGIFSRRLPRPVHSAYLLTWMLVIIGFYSLMATKYLTYIFPASFPAALLTGYYLHQFRLIAGRKRWLWLSVPACLLFLLFALATQWLPGENWLLLYGFIALAVGGIAWLQMRGKVRFMPEAIAFTAVIISFILITSALIPVAQNRSSKDAVQAIPPDTQIRIYGDYSTAAVFYTGITAKWLHAGEQVDESDVWSKKYNIPSERIADLDRRIEAIPEMYILVRKGNQQGFEQHSLSRYFQQAGEYRRYYLYKRK